MVTMRNAPRKGVGFLLRLLPYGSRFPAAIQVAQWTGYVLERFAMLRGGEFRLGATAEWALARLLEDMDNRGVAFRPSVTVVGMDELQTAAAGMRGVVVAMTHANAGLSRVIFSALDRARIPVIAISGADAFPICGAGGRTTDTIVPTGTFLLRVRGKLRRGFVVCAMLDLDGRVGRVGRRDRGNRGSVVIAEPLIRVAVRWRVPIAIVSASLHGRDVVLDVRMSPSPEVDDVVSALAAMVSAD
jgi:hypothetical protein